MNAMFLRELALRAVLDYGLDEASGDTAA